MSLQLQEAQQTPGLLFDFATWTRTYERGLMSLWDAAGGAGVEERVGGMHVVAAGL